MAVILNKNMKTKNFDFKLYFRDFIKDSSNFLLHKKPAHNMQIEIKNHKILLYIINLKTGLIPAKSEKTSTLVCAQLSI